MRRLTQTDLPWVTALAARRRRRLTQHAPRFWRPAPDARAAHTRYLAGLIDDPAVYSLRTAHAFAFGVPADDHLVVDDLAVDADNYYSTEVAELLRALPGRLRVVCPVPETARREAVEALGGQLVETWWHRDLEAQPATAPASDRVVRSGSAVGQLVHAPPVYDPGGPVLLVAELPELTELTELEQAAAAQGAGVCVVRRQVDGYRRTTDFFVVQIS